MSKNAEIVAGVSAWEGITAGPHRFGGTEFSLGKVEVGHIHGNRLVDIPFTVKLRQQLVADGEASVHHLLADSGWISYWLGDEGDVAQALKLYRLSYLQKRARRDAAFRAVARAELATLPISATLRALVLGDDLPDPAEDTGQIFFD